MLPLNKLPIINSWANSTCDSHLKPGEALFKFPYLAVTLIASEEKFLGARHTNTASSPQMVDNQTCAMTLAAAIILQQYALSSHLSMMAGFEDTDSTDEEGMESLMTKSNKQRPIQSI